MTGQNSPTHFQVSCHRLSTLILYAYVTFAEGRYPHRSEQPIFNHFRLEPEWTRTETWTIEATTSTPRTQSMMEGPMLQVVLEERFKVKVHRETRVVPIRELVIARGGAKLTAFKPGPGSCVPWDFSVFPPPALEPGQRRCTAGTFPLNDGSGRSVQQVEAMTLDDWVVSDTDIMLEKPPIVNKTGITGLQTFRFVRTGREEDFNDELKDQLGLELRPGRGPRDYLVVDHVERPTPDKLVVTPTRAMGAGK